MSFLGCRVLFALLVHCYSFPYHTPDMSDFGDIDDELLELAGATEKKRKKRQASSSKPSSAKRRKAE